MQNPVKITPHETRILLLLGKGFSNKEISGETGVSLNTVKFHLKKIYKKLNVKNRVAAIIKFNEITNHK